MKKRIAYSVANYAELVQENGYFVDKTAYIAKLEGINNPVFLRPRRFGKSLLCTMLYYYYDRKYAARFTELFGHTWIGQNPTGRQNQYFVLSMDFSTVSVGPTLHEIERSFNSKFNHLLSTFRQQYAPLLNEMPEVDETVPFSDNLTRFLNYLWANNLPALYVVIDEYDNFANQLITSNKEQLYRDLTGDDGFFKTFFKTLKEGRKTAAIVNVFITGVLPIVIDELASGFNVGTFITLEPEFAAMLGFTQAEVDTLLDLIYLDYALEPATRPEINAIIKNHYNGYHFVSSQDESLYNSTILLYFLNYLTRNGEIPKRLIDQNLKTDISWVRRLTASNVKLTEEFVDQLAIQSQIQYDEAFLIEKFNMAQFFDKSYFPISFFYLGMLTRGDDFHLQLPNLNMRQIFVEYFNEIHRIDVSTRYAAMMQAFMHDLDLAQLFAGYWHEYIGQLPEAIFTQVNENFYRTTFFELCSRYLSQWFTWNVERSYPQGKSDLEFVGKYHEKFAGLRWVLEFKYYSNHAFQQIKTTVEKFALQAEDTQQIAGYVQGLRQEYPQARIQQYVIYCFGNQGYKVFEV